MRPGRQDLNVNFFTFRSCRQLDGRQAPRRQAPIFENFPIRHIFLKFCFFKYKNEKKKLPGLVGMSEQWAGVPVTRPIVYSFLFPAGDSLIPVDALAAGWPRFLDEQAAPFPTFLY